MGEVGGERGLRLVADEWTTQVKDSVSVYLVLEVPEMEAVVAGNDELSVSRQRLRAGEALVPAGALMMRMYFRPKEEGFTTLGPFELKVGDQTLTSNPLEIQVFPDWEPGEVGYRWQLSDEEVKVGQPFGLTIRAREFGNKAESPYLQVAQGYREGKGLFKVEGGSSNGSTNTENGERVRTRRQTFTITPLQAGELRITREVFEKLPDDVVVPELIVDVLE